MKVKQRPAKDRRDDLYPFVPVIGTDNDRGGQIGANVPIVAPSGFLMALG